MPGIGAVGVGEVGRRRRAQRAVGLGLPDRIQDRVGLHGIGVCDGGVGRKQPGIRLWPALHDSGG
eukprot:11647121-Alexandrium_andersonii.AAC.1